jgi:IstB-like ATP binding protein
MKHPSHRTQLCCRFPRLGKGARLLRLRSGQAPSTPLRGPWGNRLPVSCWHEQIGDRTIAGGILDRLVHNAHRIEMRGESMRRKRNPPRENDEKKE